jgi:hypothetical protein
MPTVDQRSTARPATVTSTVDGRDHLISQQLTAAGLVTGHGEYAAICGRLVVAAPLVVGPGPTCVDCETVLHRVTTAGISLHRRRGWVVRLLRRCRPRSGVRSTVRVGHRGRA